MSGWLCLEVVLGLFYVILIETGGNMDIFAYCFAFIMWMLAIFCYTLEKKLAWARTMLVSENMMIMDIQNRRTVLHLVIEEARLRCPVGAIVAITHDEYVKALALTLILTSNPNPDLTTNIDQRL